MKSILAAMAAVLTSTLPIPSGAQSYPSRQITFVVPFGPAAGADMNARALAQGMAPHIGQTPVVDNKAGGNALIGTQAVLNAPADGHSVLLSSNSPVIFNKLMLKNVPYDTMKDFIPVAGFCSGSIVLTVSGKSPFRSVGELVDFGRKNPGKLSVGYSTSATRLSAALFQQLTGVKMLEVPYKALAPSVTAQIGGEIDVLFPPPDLAAPHIKSGNLRALGVTGKRRMSLLLPEVPTLQEAGIPSYEFTFWYGAWVKAGTPMPIVEKLREALLRAQGEPESIKFMAANACEPMRMTREEFVKFHEVELAKWAKVVKAAGIEPE